MIPADSPRGSRGGGSDVDSIKGIHSHASASDSRQFRNFSLVHARRYDWANVPHAIHGGKGVAAEPGAARLAEGSAARSGN